MNNDNEIYCFIDTETTGFFKRGDRVQAGQARVCQVAMILTNSVGEPLMKFSSLIKPDGWVIGEGAQKVHGITNEMCEQFGVSFSSVVGLYNHIANRCNTFVAHNAEFDENMMEIEVAYYNSIKDNKNVNVITPYLCTMKPNTDVVKAPKKKGSGYKWPSLAEALKFFCGRDIVNAHDALVDTEACKDIFFAARELKISGCK